MKIPAIALFVLGFLALPAGAQQPPAEHKPAAAKPEEKKPDDKKPDDKRAEEKKDEPKDKPEEKPDKKVETKHSITVGGQKIDYTATAGLISLKDAEGKPTAEIFYIAYTRDAAGQSRMYVDGELVAEETIPGAPTNWDTTMRLGLANEMTRDRTWLGEYHGVAIYSRALSPEEVREAYQSGSPTPGAVVAYDFSEGEGDVVRDVSQNGVPLDLHVADPDAVVWLPDGGLRITQSTLIASEGPATKLIDAVGATGEMSLQVWITPANTTQAGPARIVTLSHDTGQRNFTLGQGATAYEVRFRTDSTSANGEPSLWSPGSGAGALVAMGLRHPRGELVVVYLPRGGTVELDPDAVAGEDLARWYNPRTGEWSPAEASNDHYTAPDSDDWVLLVQ